MQPQYIPLRARAKNIARQRFGRLVALYPTSPDKYGKTRWFCQCDCGNTIVTLANGLRFGAVQSCGCLTRERSVAARRVHGMTETPLYRIWCDIIKRCTNPNYKQFADWGGRGIAICDEWRHDFQAFYDHVSHLPNFGKKGYTLDRIDNDGNYKPGNVRWATRAEQNHNTRANVMLAYNGKTQCVAAWAEEIGVAKDALYKRLRMGWSVERTLTTPSQRRSL